MTEGFKLSEVGIIPNEWTTIKFGEIFDIIKSHSFSRNKLTSEETESKIQNIHYGDIHSRFTSNHLDLDRKDIPFIIEGYLNDTHNQFLKDGDIVIADASEDLIDIGKCVELKNIRNRKVLGGLHTIVARDKSNHIEKGFGAYIFKNDHVIRELRSIATGMSVFGISKGNLNKLTLLLPPLSEQRGITYVLSTIQKAVEQQSKLIRQTAKLKKSLMQKLFTEGLNGEKLRRTEIGLVPESWEVIRLGDAVKIRGGFAFKSDHGISTSNTQLVRMGNLYQNVLDLERAPIFYPDNYATEFLNYVLREGDLIMSLTGTMGKEDYGFTVRVPKTTKTLLLNQRIAKFEIIDPDINQDYLKQYFLSRVFLDKLYKTAKGTKQANLSSNEMKNLLLLKPKLSEQHEIANSLGLLESKIETHVRKKQTLAELFKTLLHELMTGQRRIHHVDFPGMAIKYSLREESLSIAAEQ